jgi:predicted nucleotidyltransferase
MITIDDIIKASGLHKSRVHNIYLFGSRVYETHSDNSDWDIIVVANNSVEAIEIKSDLYNIHIYTPKKFQEDLDWHMPKNIECLFAPSCAKLQEKIKFDFTLDVRKLRHAISHVSSNSWIKAKKKISQNNDDDYYIGVKSLFHSLRIPMFATQIATTGCINDFTSANFIWNKINSKIWTWEELDLEFRELRNNILTEFRKLTEK